MERRLDFEKNKGYLVPYLEYLGATKKGKYYTCPLCDSGTKGTHSTPALRVNGDIFRCFSCGVGGDIYSLAVAYNDFTDTEETSKYGNTYIKKAKRKAFDCIQEFTGNTDYKPLPVIKKKAAEPKKGYSNDIFKQMAFKLWSDKGQEHLTYIKNRGLEDSIIKRFGIGMCDSNYIIIPYLPVDTNNGYYLKRAINNNVQVKKLNTTGGKALNVYNYTCMYKQDVKYIAICEGEINALSLIQCGLDAIALGGIDTNLLESHLIDLKALGILQDKVFIIATDPDDAGRRASKQLQEILKSHNVKCCDMDFDFHKLGYDINELLIHNKTFLLGTVERLIKYLEEYEVEKNEKTSIAN